MSFTSQTSSAPLITGRYPSTRYQGSKAKILDWIWDKLSPLNFTSVLDAFGGTGAVSYKFKQQGKKVTYNDILPFNYRFGLALIQNNHITLEKEDLEILFAHKEEDAYPSFIRDNFSGIYFTDEENDWLDKTIHNIRDMQCEYKRALAFFAIAQACLVKRPYNLFHRKNLYLRFADVQRSFGNKSSWDKSFENWVNMFISEANGAVFQGTEPCSASMCDAVEVQGEFDLVYADPPYVTEKAVATDYADLYHFLTGLCLYDEWKNLIDYRSKHHRMIRQSNPWTNKDQITQAFERLLAAYPQSILAVSYRSDGIPSAEELRYILKRHKKKVTVLNYGDYKYALSTNTNSQELLFIAY
jgi:adenine-specific DNA methylase